MTSSTSPTPIEATISPIETSTPAKAQKSDLLLKTEKLLLFRLAFACVGLIITSGIGVFTHGQMIILPVFSTVAFVIIYGGVGMLLIRRREFENDEVLRALNALFIGSDIIILTRLVAMTHGVESDIYVLYLIPILLSSYTFGRMGIMLTALFVSVSYVGLLLVDNAEMLPYLLDPSKASGLGVAYSHALWRRVLGRSLLLVSLSFFWGKFCEYMSGLAELGSNRLREQLTANTLLVAEVQAQAGREHLLNSINSAVRSTLDLNHIFETTVDELGRALNASSCAIVCHSSYADEPPVVCESVNSALQDVIETDGGIFDANVCAFVLEHKSAYEKSEVEGELVKVFVFRDPHKSKVFEPIKDSMTKLGVSYLIIQPMMYADESKGVIMIGERDRTRSWSAAELELVKTVAGQVAVAIEHAGLVDQLSRKNKDLLTKNLNLDSKNSELRMVQSQLIHQEKMASLGRMVAGIAHELNNPVNFVHGNLPYLREYFEDLKKLISSVDATPLDDRRDFYQMKSQMKYDFLVTDLDNILADLNEGADRIRHIIKNLRSFSRLDEAELKEASIQEGIESTLKILSQYYGRDKIAPKIDFVNCQPILCYPGQLNQVWMNLLSNAAQAVENLPEPSVQIKSEINGDRVCVSISDNGSGIKQEVLNKIFEPFFTTKPVGQGTGLGLSICHSIIERHGGRIWCESTVGQGTTFRVEIPIYEKATDLAHTSRTARQDPD